MFLLLQCVNKRQWNRLDQWCGRHGNNRLRNNTCWTYWHNRQCLLSVCCQQIMWQWYTDVSTAHAGTWLMITCLINERFLLDCRFQISGNVSWKGKTI